MSRGTLLLIFIIIAAAGLASAGAADNSMDSRSGDQVQATETHVAVQENHTQGEDQGVVQTPLEAQSQDTPGDNGQDHQNLTADNPQESEDHLSASNETHAENMGDVSAEQLQEDLHNQTLKLEQEHSNLTTDIQEVERRHVNESALVEVLQNASYADVLLGSGPTGIGPQVSSFARDWNASLQSQIQAETQIRARNPIVRFFLGGDRQAGSALSRAVLENQDRIRQMQQLILQCQACDPQVKAVLQGQLQQMTDQQAAAEHLAQAEMQDTGLFGWIGR